MQQQIPNTNLSAAPETSQPVWIDVVEQRIKNLQYGSIQIVVHNSRVVEVDVIEKARLAERPNPLR